MLFRPSNENISDDHRIIITTRGLLNTCFYDDIQIQGNIHKGEVEWSTSSQVLGFEMDGVTIDENESYQEVQMVICTLNGTISKEGENTNTQDKLHIH